MESQLNFVFMLPLKEIAMRKVAINLWSEPDILGSIEKFSPALYSDYSKAWCKIIDSKIRHNMSKLVLPKSLKKQMLPVITPIGIQIKRWKQFHTRYLAMPDWEGILEKYLVDSRVKFDAPILAKLCWTTSGKINYGKTAENLIRCEMVDIVKRYQLACLFCLEDYIPVLWEELPEEIKGKFYNEADISQVKMGNLSFCWPYILKGKKSKLDFIATEYFRYTTFHQLAFDYSASIGNKAATEYFFRKLTQEEKEDSFISTVVDRKFRGIEILHYSDMFQPLDFSDILCYLLSQLNHEEQMENLKIHSACFFLCFMDWPCQDLFLKNANLIWDLLPVARYDYLLWKIRGFYGYSNFYYPKFFQEFLTHSPVSFRKKFVDRERRSGYFLRTFFYIQDTETVKVIFSNVDAADRVRLVSSKHILVRLYKCILKGRRHKVKVFLREATLCKEDTERLKDTFMEFLKENDGGQSKNKRVWMRFCQILDEILASDQRKRCLEDETLNKAKKLRCDVLENC